VRRSNSLSPSGSLRIRSVPVISNSRLAGSGAPTMARRWPSFAAWLHAASRAPEPGRIDERQAVDKPGAGSRAWALHCCLEHADQIRLSP
jgi:hypothetical protein